MMAHLANPSAKVRNTFYGILFASPWLIGVSVFWIYPTLASAYYSLNKFNAVQALPTTLSSSRMTLISFRRSSTLFTLRGVHPAGHPAGFWTGHAAQCPHPFPDGVPYHLLPAHVGAGSSFSLGMGLSLYPCDWSLVNLPFDWLGLKGLCWLTCTQWAMPTLILLALWIIGQQIILYLAGLQDVPQDLYDAADVDGAKFWRKLRNVTIPMMTPVIFFHLVTSVIGAMQFFAIPYVMTGGTGFPGGSTMFYSIYLYKNAFHYFEMGYASAMAWLLFLMTLGITLVIFRSARLWVFYAGGDTK